MNSSLLTQNVSVNSKPAQLNLTQADNLGAWILIAEDAMDKSEIFSLAVDDIVGVNLQNPGKCIRYLLLHLLHLNAIELKLCLSLVTNPT